MTKENVEPTPNPYNARKEWHHADAPDRGNANGLFYETRQEEENQATFEKAPETQKRTNYKKRYDDLKKHYDEKISSFKQRELELLAQAQQAEPAYRPPKSVEDLKAFREQNPDLYETVESVAHLRTQTAMETVQQKLSALEQRERHLAKKEAETTLQRRHPDFEDIRGDENFHNWAKQQPVEIQNWIYKNPDNVELAVKAIDLYKTEKGIATSKKMSQSQTRGNAADFVSTKTTSVNTNEPRVWSQREIAKMSMRDFDKFEEEIDQAIAEGRMRP
tara:strand:+ start:2779 stop:3606 length:828 start_codon:yes stop_codon:yes gene_type:complete